MIRRIVIRNYRGIEEKEVELGEAGAVAKGRNGSGKTTLLRAVKAALMAQDVKADAIKKGSEKAEILVDLDDLSVRRVITQNASTVSVSVGEFAVRKPQTYLSELLGTSSLDPMDLLLLKGKERLQKVLDALPVRVTVEQLRTWWPKCPDDFDVTGHGLEVVARVRRAAYERRTDINRDLKSTRTESERLKTVAVELGRTLPRTMPDPVEAKTAHEAARSRLAELTSRAKLAEEQAARTVEQRERIAAMRLESEGLRRAVTRVDAGTIEAARGQLRTLSSDIAQLRKLLAEKELEAKRIADQVQAWNDQNASATMQERAAADLASRADVIEQGLAQATIAAPSSEELAIAKSTAEQAEAALSQAESLSRSRDEWLAALKVSDAAAKELERVAAEARRLDGIVEALTHEAPAALMNTCEGIAGLTVDGEDVLWNGVKLDTLCGAEQVRVCVDIARRLNSKAKILLVDGLERLDEEQMDVFVREATRDGYQLLATRVYRGEMVIEHIATEEAGGAL